MRVLKYRPRVSVGEMLELLEAPMLGATGSDMLTLAVKAKVSAFVAGSEPVTKDEIVGVLALRATPNVGRA